MLGCCWSLMEAFGRISCFTWPLSRCSHLGIWILPSPSFHSACPVFGCCLWSTPYGFSGTLALLGSTVDTCLVNFSTCYVEVDSNPEAFFSIRPFFGLLFGVEALPIHDCGAVAGCGGTS